MPCVRDPEVVAGETGAGTQEMKSGSGPVRAPGRMLSGKPPVQNAAESKPYRSSCRDRGCFGFRSRDPHGQGNITESTGDEPQFIPGRRCQGTPNAACLKGKRAPGPIVLFSILKIPDSGPISW
jgi:hypothetical protein